MFLSSKLNFIFYFHDLQKLEDCELFDTTLVTEDVCEHYLVQRVII